MKILKVAYLFTLSPLAYTCTTQLYVVVTVYMILTYNTIKMTFNMNGAIIDDTAWYGG